jgi:hypothetical protein
VVDNSRFEHNGDDGIEVRTGEASITRSVAAGNGGDGIVVSFNGKANVTWTTAEHNGNSGYRSSGQMTIEQSVARGNNEGVTVTDFSTGRVSNSVVTNNASFDFSVASGSTLLTRRNNMGGTWSGTLTQLAPI